MKTWIKNLDWKIDKIRNYLIEEILNFLNLTNNELNSKKHEKVSRVLNYIDHSLIAIFTISVQICICIHLLSPPLFSQVNTRYEMNDIVNQFFISRG